MLFNSTTFLVFVVSAFALYWSIFYRNRNWRNAFLLVTGYVFYGWWDYRFLGLIALSTIVDFAVGRAMFKSDSDSKRKLLLTSSIAVNLGILGFFKYYNFFINSFADFSEGILGLDANPSTLSIILPVGISFYTFQTLSYTIDLYRRQIEPSKNFIEFAAFVSFFPQLVAGPIERAANLLPQFREKKRFTYRDGSSGMRLIIWGLFKKTVIADNCAPYVNEIFENYQELPAPVLFMGAVFFAFQIYGDFSGYSDIAIGTARLFGFRLMTNFNYPYFSRSVGEFWRRWHISLSTWFRDYVYIPIGGSRKNLQHTIRNLIVVFLVSGLWHGANWTFVAWGGLHAAFMIPALLLPNNRFIESSGKMKIIPNIGEFLKLIRTFFLVTVAWVFFRASDVSMGIDYLSAIFTRFSLPENFYYFPPWLLALILLMVILEWLGKDSTPDRSMNRLKPWIRYGLYLSLFAIWFFYNAPEKQEFIYFQF